MSARTLLFDDLDDSEGAKTMGFSVDGISWSIDVSAEHRTEFDAFMARYIKVARKVEESSEPKPRAAKKPKHASPGETAKIRAWGLANGWNVKPSGRVPGDLEAAYRADPNGSVTGVTR